MEKLRQTGIHIVGDVPWGTHLCHFYKTKEDLTDILALYFKSGLQNNEYCIWVTSEPLHEKDVEEAMNKVLPDFQTYLNKGQIEIISYDAWYAADDGFDREQVLQGWIEKLNQALNKGYAGLRLTGNLHRIKKKEWDSLIHYEHEVNRAIGKYRILAICSYPLVKCGAKEIMDVVSNHECSLIKSEGEWKLVENSECTKTKENLRESQEFYGKLVRQSVEAIYIFDPETKRLLEANNAFSDLLGYTAEEIDGLTLHDFVIDKRERIDAYVYHLLMSGAMTIGERLWQRKDKTLVDVQVTASKIRQKGKDICFVVARDITEHKRAKDELTAARERLQTLSKSLLEKLENERRYIARELHDEIGQKLTVVRMNLETMQHSSNSQKRRNSTKENITIVESLFEQVRNLSLNLRPSILDDLGLIPALRWYASRIEQEAEITIRHVEDFVDYRPPKEIETACFRVIQETLTNVMRHAKARQVIVELQHNENELKLSVADDGVGFDVKSAQERAVLGESFGLLGMQERVMLLGGTIKIESVQSGGTKVKACFPIR